MFKESERYYLLVLSTQIYGDHPPELMELEVPVHISYSIEIPSASVKPLTTLYTPCSVNISAKEKEHLDFLPYEDSTNSVYYSTDLDVYKTNLFNQIEHKSEFIQNLQFFEYLALSLVKYFPITSDWIQVCSILADCTGKDRRNMVTTFDDIIKKHLHSEEVQLDKQEFQDNFCQICMKYVCSTHFYDLKADNESDQADELPAPKINYNEDAMIHIEPTQWKSKWWSNINNLYKSGKWITNYKCLDFKNCGKIKTQAKAHISSRKAQILKKTLKLGLKNPCALSLLITTPCKATAYLIEKYSTKYTPPNPIQKLPKKVYYTSNFDYKLILTNVIETHCKCIKECTVKSKCPCLIGEINNAATNKIINRKCCEKYCLCSTDCKVRFLGCSCQYGKCDGVTCICFVNQRECDPLVCIFCVCYHSFLHKPKDVIQKKTKKFSLCRNVRASIRLHKRTAMGASTIKNAGMGLFVLEGCLVNDYITQYTGELIRESESERRAAVYDYKHHSYIFSLSPDIRWSIDSTYIGSKMRYANHKSHNEHNTYSQVWNINGNLKILLFAAQKIQPMNELFFDYGYNISEIKYQWLQEYEKKFKKSKSSKLKHYN